METLTIQYTCNKTEKYTSLTSGIFLFAICLYLVITQALANNYGSLFFISTIGALLGLALFFTFTWWQPSPLLSINNQQIVTNLPKMKGKSIEWGQIKDIAIGGGHIKITTNSEQFLDLGSIRYSDINRIKSKIVEICETKGITFHND